MDSKNISEIIVKAADNKKAYNISVFDVNGKSSVTDSFVVCSGSSIVQVQAIADNIVKELAEQKMHPLRREGNRDSKWILLDYGACVVHIFIEEERQFYKLENLWRDVKTMEFDVK